MRLVFRFGLIILCSFLLACTDGGGGDDDGGGGGDDDDRLSTNACSTLGLGSRSINGRIVNGSDCNAEGSPVVRLVFITRSNDTGFCSGTMITGNDVLTAAHCFFGPIARVVMVSGKDLDDSRNIEAADWSIHPGFSVGGTLAFNDVAVVHLEFDAGLPTVPILSSQNVDDSEVVSIFGYGTNENGDFDFEDLESGEMRVSDVTISHIGADFDGEGSNTCTGDSGGPAVSTRLGFSSVAGITSTGTQFDCLEGDTTWFTNVASPEVQNFLRTVVPDASFQ